jgi:pyruvate carboxylase
MAKELEKMGAHILAIKDMAGLCKPYAAELLVKTLKQEIGIPIHFHTHDTSGVQAAAVLKASEAQVDIADAAISSMSGMTSQPNLNSLVEALRYTPRDTGLDFEHLQSMALYWEAVRQYYSPFETGMMASTADVYNNEIPGGQYTNLYEQAKAVGMAPRWPEICKMYAEVNRMLGDIVKVTPSSKAIGDMALFMISNDLTVADVLESKRELAFPESVVDLVSGKMGQPPGGFPETVQRRILRGEASQTGRPGESLPPLDFGAIAAELEKKVEHKVDRRDVLSYIMFPRVYTDYSAHVDKFSDVSILPTDVFFYGFDQAQEVSIDIESGKTLVIKFLSVGDPHPDGSRTVYLELNGLPRNIDVIDTKLEPTEKRRQKADKADPMQIGAPMPGMVVTVAAKVGDSVVAGQKLLSLEAMKMETTLYAERDGKVAELLVAPGVKVDSNDLMLRLE